jgi:hypothetical protein
VQAAIQTLTKLKHLNTIVLTVSSNVVEDVEDLEDIEDAEVEDEKKVERMILNAQAVLTASPSIECKTLVVKRPGVTDTILYV